MNHDTGDQQSRPRRLWRWLAALVLVVPLLVVGIVLWVFLSGSGRDLVLSQARGFLPPGALSWGAAEGRLSGGLVLHDVVYRDADLSVELARLELDLSATALLGGEVHVRRLVLADGRVILPQAEATDEPWPARIELPDSLPDLALPLAIRLDALRVETLGLQQGGESLLQLHSLTAAAELADGRLRLDGLRLDSDRGQVSGQARIDTLRRWASDIRLKAGLALADSGPLPVELRVRGSLDDLRVDASADPGAPASLQLRLHGGLPQPEWNLQLEAPRIDPARLGLEGGGMALALSGEGSLAEARLQGSFAQDELELRLAPSRLTYADASLDLAPLALELLDGTVEINGTVDGSGAQPELALGLGWRGLNLPAAADAVPVRSHGQGRIDGPLDAYALELDGRFLREQAEARLTLSGHGSLQALELERLHAALPTGGLDASGRVVWDPALALRLDATLEDFDPSYFVPDLPGSIAATLQLEGGIDADKPFGEIRLEELSGQLQGRELSGSARVSSDRQGHGAGQLALGLGASRVSAQGRWDQTLAVDARIDVLELADLLPEAAGSLRGTLALRGTPSAPQLEANLEGTGLAFEQHAAAGLKLRAALDAQQRAVFSLEASDPSLAGQDFDTLVLSGEGTEADHAVSLALDGAPGRLGLELAGGLDAARSRWQGELRQLALEPDGHAAWQLREPAAVRVDFDTATVALAATCLDAQPASACIQVDAQGQAMQGRFELAGLELALFDALLSSAVGQPLSVDGELAANGHFERGREGDLRAQAELSLPELALRSELVPDADSFALRDLHARLELDPQQALLELAAVTGDAGYLRARIGNAEPMGDAGELDGSIELLLPELGVLGLFSDQIASPRGRVEGHLQIAGTRAEPRIDGDLELLDFSAELPALGIAPDQGRIHLRSSDASRLDLSGSLRLGEGTVQLDGHVDLAAADGLAGTLAIRGENLEVASIPEAKVRASPDLQLSLAGSRLKLRGAVEVPWARIDLERLESVATPSSDVVIVDDPESGTGLAIDADISVTLGSSVRMSGFGLRGTLAGQVRVRELPDQPTTARGAIEVGGRYKAYGQDLTITRGQVAWASTPIDTPALDVRAQRKIDAITVGVQVRGTAMSPELSLWSEPAMEQAEQLSYLILGRPLRSASQAEGSELSQAAAALGGNYLAKGIGERLGLDEIEVADNRALGGAALTVGMYLSPRLHVSYGVALFGNGQVMSFKYLLSRLWNIQLDSGTEDRVTLNYRLEK